jgi:hypothetical protein
MRQKSFARWRDINMVISSTTRRAQATFTMLGKGQKYKQKLVHRQGNFTVTQYKLESGLDIMNSQKARHKLLHYRLNEGKNPTCNLPT